MSYSSKNGEINRMVGGTPAPRLLDEMRRVLRLKHYSLRTEAVYVGWVRRFVLFHGKRHPRDMGGEEVEQFLSGLAVQGEVAASTQNQALSALLFLYRDVLGAELPWLDGVIRAKRPSRVPTVLSRDEVARALACMDGRPWLLASLLYGTGMRLMEALRLRVKDVDFDRGDIIVRDGKGGKDRHTMLPRVLAEPMRREIERAAALHAADLAAGFGRYGCRLPWPASIRTRQASLAGSTCFLPRSDPWIREAGRSAGIISMHGYCRGRSSAACVRRAS
jgi:integrase